MSKKMFCSMFVVLVLVLALTSTVEAADPSLVGRWKFDETSGTTAFDSTGNGNDGTFNGDPKWVPGKIGGALEFNGDDYLNCGNGASLQIQDEITIAFWFKVEAFQTTWEAFMTKGDNSYRTGRGGGNGDATHLGLTGTSVGGGNGWFNGTTIITGGDWHHFAGTYDGTEGRIYIDGVLDVTSPGTGQINISTYELWIGTNSQNTDRLLHGLMDDVRIYSRALSVEEIREAMKGIPPGSASNPSPANEATDVPQEVTLFWTPGEFAAPTNGHKVYFGESFDDVNEATGAVAQTAAGYAPAQRLDFDTTYYWRIDEVNAPPSSTIFKGDVWSFTTEPVAYAIENITATASSSCLEDSGPENTINGSGLDANDLHSTVELNMWISSDEPNGAWIEYELDKVHKLHELWVWNANQIMESVIGFGLKDVTIEHSVDGNDYATLGTTHEFAQATGLPDYEHNTTVDFVSAAAKHIRLTANSNWGGIFERYGLSEVRFFSIPVYAREPDPDSGTTDISIGTIDNPVDVTLDFRAGRDSARHDVYFSTDEQAVIDGNAPVATVTEASYGPLPLDLGTTYFWRVDEINDAETPAPTTWQGDIWNFRTQEYFVVDDFEDYNDYPPNEIWATWIDGYGVPANGATVGYPAPDWNQDEHYVETAIVHGGQQAMPYFYDNSGPANYSEATFTLSSQFDWTMKGADVLSLRFRGKPTGLIEAPAGTYTMSGAGYDIWNDADEFRYAYKLLSGDGSIVAQVLSVEDTHQWAKAGVMIRETLEPGSKFAALYMTVDNGCRFQARLQTDIGAISDSSVTTLADVNTPHWVKLERVGNEFNAYDSNDGVTWTPLVWNPQTISMYSNVYVGLALTSHNSGVTCVAEFSDVQTTASSPFTQQAIGVEMPTNDPAQMYVALASSGGTPALVFHDDPGATLVNTWTEWTIDLQEFAAQGVNLTNVNTFSIGFGDKNNLQPGGSGVVFFDDIRLYRSNEPEQEPEP